MIEHAESETSRGEAKESAKVPTDNGNNECTPHRSPHPTARVAVRALVAPAAAPLAVAPTASATNSQDTERNQHIQYGNQTALTTKPEHTDVNKREPVVLPATPGPACAAAAMQ